MRTQTVIETETLLATHIAVGISIVALAAMITTVGMAGVSKLNAAGVVPSRATLSLAVASTSPQRTQIIASRGANEDEKDEVEFLRFTLQAGRESVNVDKIQAVVRTTKNSTAHPDLVYLYSGSTLLDTAQSGPNNVVTFDSLEHTILPGAAKIYSIRMDIINASETSSALAVVVKGQNVLAKSARGSTIKAEGGAVGDYQYIYNKGPELSLVGTPTITKSQTSPYNGVSTTTVQATFNVRVRAVGGDVSFGTQAAWQTFGFALYNNGRETTSTLPAAISFFEPSSGVIHYYPAPVAFTVPEANEVTIPVTYLLQANASTSVGSYAVGMKSIRWSIDGGVTKATSAYMKGLPQWQTPVVSLP